MKKILFTLVLSLFVSLGVSAQNKPHWQDTVEMENIPAPPNAAPGSALKISVLSPFEQYASIKLSGELKQSEHWSIQGGVGYYFHYTYDKERLDTRRPNFFLGLEERYYVPGEFLNGLYLAGRLDYSHIAYMSGVEKYTPTLNPQNPVDIQLDFNDPWKYTMHDIRTYAEAGLEIKVYKRIALDLNIAGGLHTIINDRITPRESYYGVDLGKNVKTTFSPGAIIGFNLCYFLTK